MKNTNKNENEKSETPNMGLVSPQDDEESGNVHLFSPLGSNHSEGSEAIYSPHQEIVNREAGCIKLGR